MVSVGGKQYPMYRTMRGMIDFEKSEHADKLGSGNIEAVCYSAYCLIRGACIREGIGFELGFEAFLDEVEPGLMDKLIALNPPEEKKPEAGDSL